MLFGIKQLHKPSWLPTWLMPYGSGARLDDARTSAEQAITNFGTANFAQSGTVTGGGKVTEEIVKRTRQASHELNVAAIELKSARGGLIGSIQNLFLKMGNVIGVKGTFGGGTEKYAENVKKIVSADRVSLIERTLSKPIRIVSKYPKIAVIGTGLLAVIGIGSAMSKRAERRTQNAAMQDALTGQMGPAQPEPQQPSAQANVTYQITPDEYAAMQAKMRGGTTATPTGHADNLVTARQQQQAQPVTASL